MGTPALTDEEVARLNERAQFVRLEVVRLIDIAKTGHYTSAFSCAEIFAVLYYDVMRLRRGEPDWPDRDRLLLGKGHAAVGQYPILADLGFLDHETLDAYTRLGNPLGDHPDMTRVPGVDFSSGSLGHNLSVGLGIALGGRLNRQDFHTYVILGDGELEEGQNWEAAMLASHSGVERLVAIVDRNQYSLDGVVDEMNAVEPLADKWWAFGWNVHAVDGHDVAALSSVLRDIRDNPNGKPTAVIAKTVKGKGVKFMEENFGWHLGWLDEDDRADVLTELKANS
ncbi:transketolase [Mycolicibacterium agri]|uniref:Transketolase n=1 Tax=Mycolicibacterium agri TaxID=36811 RepID=A0A2A7NFY6_MYCAG|nr:transketolase [Mycolicibacterium agri]PEG42683.1 transketolase [Mycolicibacterium agri]GFG52661.1 transketolase [Mycolicibacterium agri]